MTDVLVFHKGKLWLYFIAMLTMILFFAKSGAPVVEAMVSGQTIELDREVGVAAVGIPVLLFYLLQNMKRLFFVGDAIRLHADRVWFNSGLFGRSFYWTHIDIIKLVQRETVTKFFNTQHIVEMHVVCRGRICLRFKMNDVDFDREGLKRLFAPRVNFEFEGWTSEMAKSSEPDIWQEPEDHQAPPEAGKPAKKIAYGVRKRKW